MFVLWITVYLIERNMTKGSSLVSSDPRATQNEPGDPLHGLPASAELAAEAFPLRHGANGYGSVPKAFGTSEF